MDSQWYKDAVLYELDVRSFSDADGDGVGDLPGLADKLDYLQDLGVTALMLRPSPHAPEGQDAHDVAPRLSGVGCMQDLERLLSEAHARGIRVITELLISQLSEQIPNVDDPRMLRAVLTVMRHWLDMGLDGVTLAGIPNRVDGEASSVPEMHKLVKGMRAMIDQRYAKRVLLARTTHSLDDSTTYFGDGDECHMALSPSLIVRLLIALIREDRSPLVQGLRGTLEIPASCQWALYMRNQDEFRLAPLFDNDRVRIELGYGLLFSLPGSPVIYYGDEIGMGDSIDGRGHADVRTPMQWSDDRSRGFSRADPSRLYAPMNADPVYGYRAVNVETQRRRRFSLLNWTRRLIAVRREHAAFGRGSTDFIESGNPSIFAYVRRHGDERILVVANLSRHAQSVDLFLGPYAGAQPVELLGGPRFRPIGADPYSLTLGPYLFYWFLLSRRVIRPAPPLEVGARGLSAQTEARAAPAARSECELAPPRTATRVATGGQ